jgi:hypothetical protein
LHFPNPYLLIPIPSLNNVHNQVHGAHENRSQDQRRNVLNINALAQKVNMVDEDRQQKQDDGVHDEDADAERQDDDRAENEREKRLQKPVEEGEYEGNEQELGNRGVHDEAGYEKVGEPKRESVAEYGESDFCEPMHGIDYSMGSGRLTGFIGML